ncbi:hypothetical protein SADUNF_Sadunf19G0091500 [Salix dunnii]|uniref:Uncharacterized protein n=1 Tax=Salix dunnii TaxID=1413687 RepID=A0A835MCS4_9ROSI|nr:hypothetical protein SADUNF_Sadunf19G0091500 [Salix dunnii]
MHGPGKGEHAADTINDVCTALSSSFPKPALHLSSLRPVSAWVCGYLPRLYNDALKFFLRLNITMFFRWFWTHHLHVWTTHYSLRDWHGFLHGSLM